jgi:alcohol dehydrogenase Myb-SANT-like transcription factor
MGRPRKVDRASNKQALTESQKIPLAKFVESKASLWKISHPEYRLTDKKLLIWKEISETLNITGKLLKQKFNFSS